MRMEKGRGTPMLRAGDREQQHGGKWELMFRFSFHLEMEKTEGMW